MFDIWHYFSFQTCSVSIKWPGWGKAVSHSLAVYGVFDWITYLHCIDVTRYVLQSSLPKVTNQWTKYHFVTIVRSFLINAFVHIFHTIDVVKLICQNSNVSCPDVTYYDVIRWSHCRRQHYLWNRFTMIMHYKELTYPQNTLANHQQTRIHDTIRNYPSGGYPIYI